MVQKRKRRCRPAGEEVFVTKQATVSKAITTDSLDNGGKVQSAGGLDSGVRPKGKPSKVRILTVDELRAQSNLPAKVLNLPKNAADAVLDGQEFSLGDDFTDNFMVVSDGMALGIVELVKGVPVAVVKFDEPATVDADNKDNIDGKMKLGNDTLVESLPIQDLLEAHWDIHIMWLLKNINAKNPVVKDLSTEDIVNLHARIVDALKFRGIDHPHPPDTGLDMFSYQFERFAAKQPRHFQRPSSGGGVPLKKAAPPEWAFDPFQEVPPDEGTYKFTIQNHYNGHWMHSDLRIGYKPDELLIGWELHTIDLSLPGPVTSTMDAIEAAQAEINLIDWSTGRWKRDALTADQRPPHPWVWLDVQGKTAEHRVDDPFVAPGASYGSPAVWVIVERGQVEFGLQSGKFHEYFLHGKNMNARIVFEQITWKEAEKIKTESIEKVDSTNLPPSDDYSGENVLWHTGPWAVRRMDSNRPMVLSKEAPMPPAGRSALPAAIRKQISAKYQYWKAEGEKARARRDELVDAIAAGSVALDFDATFGKVVKKCSPTNSRFVLQKWTNSPNPPGAYQYQARVDFGDEKHLVLKFAKHYLPCHQSVEVGIDHRPDMMDVRGEIRPTHFLNVEKAQTHVVEVVDEGNANVMALGDGLIRINFDGQKMKGVRDIRKSGDEWATLEAPEERVVSKDYVNILKFDKDDEERLVLGIVLEPDEVDAHNDTIKAGTIKETAHNFLSEINVGTELGIQHQIFGEIGVKLVESYLAPIDMTIGGQKVKKGSWLIVVKVLADQLWEDIKAGKFTGFSIGGIATVAAAAA